MHTRLFELCTYVWVVEALRLLWGSRKWKARLSEEKGSFRSFYGDSRASFLNCKIPDASTSEALRLKRTGAEFLPTAVRLSREDTVNRKLYTERPRITP